MYFFMCMVLCPSYTISVNAFVTMFLLHALFLCEHCVWLFPIIWFNGFLYLGFLSFLLNFHNC